MASFMTIPEQQFFDDTGAILAGGKVYTYEVGTSTPKSSYPTIADAIAGTNANSNPVVLDSAGRANIVLGGATKVILKNSLGEAAAGDTPAGTTIWSVDNVQDESTVLDTNGNKVLTYATTASAVNYVTITNAATGNAAIIDTAGTDATPNLKIQADAGAGTVEIVGLQISAGSTFKMYEDVGNGTNFVGIKAPTSVASNLTFTLPGTAGAANSAIVTDGAQTLSFSTVTLAAATQAQQEAATSNIVLCTPGIQQYHPSSAKMWATVGVSADIGASYNLTSVTDTGTGVATFTIATDFSSGNYSAVACAESSATGVFTTVTGSTKAAGSVRVSTISAAGAATDPLTHSIVCFGDQ